MTLTINLRDDGHSVVVRASVLAIHFVNGQRLYAVTSMVDGAAWYGLIHENSTALMEVSE